MAKKLYFFNVLFLVVLKSCSESVVEETSSDLTPIEKVEAQSDYTFNQATANTITFSGESIKTTGTGTTVKDNVVTITTGGEYLVLGEGTNAQLVVNAGATDVVKLGFKNLKLAYNKSSPLFIDLSNKTIMHLLEGTTELSDGSSYTVIDKGQNATIYSQSYLSITGNAKLKIQGNFEDAINSKDGLVIQQANLELKAKDEGLRGKDYLVIRNSTLDINTGGDGIKSDIETDSAYGYVNISNSACRITTTSGDGVYGYSYVLAKGSKFEIFSGGGSNKVKNDLLSVKGFKSTNTLTLEDCNVNYDGADDGIHTNGDISIIGGVYKIASSDDGIHANKSVSIKNSNISIIKSYEGIEAFSIIVENNTISIISSNDSFNGTAGTRVMKSDGSSVVFKGGTYILNGESGDPLDSNGNITMESGNVIIHGPSKTPEVPIDYNGTFQVNGGLVMASGIEGRMIQTASNSSKVNTVRVVFRSTKPAQSLITITNDVGGVLTSFKPVRAFSTIIFTSKDLLDQKSYKIYSGGEVNGDSIGGFYLSPSKLSNGTLEGEFKIGGVITNVTY
jgi:hypothetical protein